MLSVHGLDFAYAKRNILSQVAFDLEPGVLCGLFGPNGSGKTTLFKCCLGLLAAKSGRVHLDGEDVQALGVSGVARVAAYVPQEHSTTFSYSVSEIVLMGRTPHMAAGLFGIPESDRRLAWEALAKLGIDDLGQEDFNSLSGGQRQLVLIARAVAQNTKIILLDEPTSSLDFKNQLKVWSILKDLASEGRAILACCHDPNHVAWHCSQVLLLHKGHILAQGTPVEVLDEQNLDILYQGSCSLRSVDGLPVVLPRFEPERPK
jgi:iron complex transport system ATP-binding protein